MRVPLALPLLALCAYAAPPSRAAESVTAEGLVRTYEEAVRQTRSTPIERRRACRESLRREKGSAPEALVDSEAAALQTRLAACRALASGGERECSALDEGLTAGPGWSAREECRRTVLWRRLMADVVLRQPTADALCRTVFSFPGNAPVSDHIPPERIPSFCAALVSAHTAEELLSRARALARRPFTADEEKVFLESWTSILAEGHRCPGTCERADEGCCEHVAFRRAALARSPAACGPGAPLCAALIGRKTAACAPLAEGLADAVCRRRASAPPPSPEQLRRAERQAEDALAERLTRLEGCRPASGKDCRRERQAVRALRERLSRARKKLSSSP